MILQDKRSVLGVGVHSFGVVLPKIWCDNQNIQKKDTLKVLCADKALIFVKPEDFEEISRLLIPILENRIDTHSEELKPKQEPEVDGNG